MTTAWVPPVWQRLLDHDVRQVAYVPDAGLAPLIELARTEPTGEQFFTHTIAL